MNDNCKINFRRRQAYIPQLKNEAMLHRLYKWFYSAGLAIVSTTAACGRLIFEFCTSLITICKSETNIRKAKKHAFVFFTLHIFAIGTAGCVINKTADYIKSIEQDKPLDTNSLYKEELESKGLNTELFLMEKGRIAQLQGKFDNSRTSFEEEIEFLKKRELDDNTLPGAQINVGSVLVNDNLLAYKARLFEVEMIYLSQCFNYLAKGDLEGAMVEIRLAEFLLNEAEKARENEDFYKEEYYRNTEAEIQKKMFDNQQTILRSSQPQEKVPKNAQVSANTNIKNNTPTAADPEETDTTPADNKNPEQTKYEQLLQKASEENFKKMAELLAKAKSSVLNPYVVYVGGIVHEMNGELDDAYISYKKGLELMPANPYLQKDVIRLAIKLNKTNDYEELESSYPEIWKQIKFKPSLVEQNGRLIVLYENGWIPQKKEIFISLGAVAIAYPSYQITWKEPLPMLISSESEKIGLTSPICYMSALALRALKEEEKWRIIRQAARLAIKGSAFATGTAMVATGDNTMQAIGAGIMVASAIYNNISEKADIRCWMTLPENVQILAVELPTGEHKLTFTPSSQIGQLHVTEIIPILINQTTIVRIVHVGTRLIYQRLWPKVPAEILENTNKTTIKSKTASKNI